MSTQAKSALAECAEALKTAFAWSLLAVGFYLVTFIDVTGAGSLYASLGGLREDAQAAVEKPTALRAISVSARAREAASLENRMFVVVDHEPKEPMVSASIPAPESFVGWPSAGVADSSKWKRGLRGRLRNFTVYGQGDQASVGRFAAPSRPASLPPATAIIPARGTAAEIGSMEATSRPGLGTRVRGGGGYASASSVRNVR